MKKRVCNTHFVLDNARYKRVLSLADLARVHVMGLTGECTLEVQHGAQLPTHLTVQLRHFIASLA